MMNPMVLFELRRRWLQLRMYRAAGTVLTDYKIIQNYARRLTAGAAK